MMMTDRRVMLSRNGYSEYETDLGNADAYFMKKVRDSEGTLRYILRAEVYDARKYKVHRVDVVLKAHLYLDSERHLSVQSPPIETLEDLRREEQLISDVYERMGCIPDVNND